MMIDHYAIVSYGETIRTKSVCPNVGRERHGTANAVLVGMVLSQFLASEPFRGSIAFVGTIAFSLLHVGAYLLMRGGGK